MNNYYKILLIMAAFFTVTITFPNIQVEAACRSRSCTRICTRKLKVGICNGDECKCFEASKYQF
uniref:Potassium channel blocker pMeKTx25-1 n=1 Tax=Mesobuthus eupeus TaxID=34648 RepID=A0A088DAY3_MESEU|nr:potassium channel blocker pMeKTx25-1 [Mesobuthus eupeus]